MEDPRLKMDDEDDPPFDPKRMIWGGSESFLGL